MKKIKIHNIISYGINIIFIGFIIFSNKGFMFHNDKLILKNMSESTQVSDLNKSINELEVSHEEYQNYIQTKKTDLATAITNAGVTTNGNDTFETITTNVSKILENKTDDATAVTSEILTGKTAYVKGTKITGTMPNRGAWTNIPTGSGKVTIPEGYHNGSGYVDTSTAYSNGVTAGSNNSKTTVRLYAYYSTHDNNPPRDYQTIYLYVNGKSVWADNFNMYQGNGFSYDKTWTY